MSFVNQLLANKGVRWIGLGWIGFISENLILSHNRQDIINSVGDDTYHMIYNVLSTSACGSIAYGFFKHGKSAVPVLGTRGKAVQVIAMAVQTIGLIGISQAAPAFQVPVEFRSQTAEEAQEAGMPLQQKQQMTSSVDEPPKRKLYVRCPMDFRHKKGDNAIYGTDRVSRHALLWSFGFTALGSAMTTPFAPAAVMFSFPIVFSLIGSEHQDYRYRRSSGGLLTPEREVITSNIPFAALLAGKQSWSALAEETKWTNAGMAAMVGVIMALRRWK